VKKLSGQWSVARNQSMVVSRWPLANVAAQLLSFAAFAEERLQQLRGTTGQNSTSYFHAVIQLMVVHDLHDRVNRSRLGVIRTVNQATDARVHQRSSAHCARFNCSKQLAVGEAVVTNDSTGFAQGHDLGVGGGVVVSEVPVPATGNDAAVAHDDGADGDFSCVEGALGGAEGFLHVELVEGVVGRWSLGFSRWSLVVGRWHGTRILGPGSTSTL
jgi:hypothetical protein